MATQSQKEQKDELQKLGKRSKLSPWLRLVLSVITLILVGLAIAWILDQFAIIPTPWSNILSKIFPVVAGGLGLILNKDFVQSFIQRIFSSPSDASGTSAGISSRPQGSTSITVSPVITVFPPREEAPAKVTESNVSISGSLPFEKINTCRVRLSRFGPQHPHTLLVREGYAALLQQMGQSEAKETK